MMSLFALCKVGKNTSLDPSSVLNNRCLTLSDIQKPKYSTHDYVLWAWLLTACYGPVVDLVRMVENLRICFSFSQILMEIRFMWDLWKVCCFTVKMSNL